MSTKFDLVIIGSGLGGSAAAKVLQATGKSILIVERGDYVKQEKENWDVNEVSVKRRYDSPEKWLDGKGKEFSPRTYYNVGGSTKFYGGTALRFRETDFQERAVGEGRTVAWPFAYAELAPWYEKAEELLEVHGQTGEDPTEPPRGEFPYPALVHEPTLATLAEKLSQQGLHPIHLPIAIDQGVKGKCIKGSPCDGFPCMYRAKGDAENRILRPLLLKKHPNVTLWTNALVDRLETSPDGKRVVAAHVVKNGEVVVVEGEHFIVAAGAVNSAALLLKSKSPAHPKGLANSSDQVGRNFMSHNNTVLLALHPFRKNPTKFQKTLTIHDFYQQGTFQGRGKVQPEMLQGKKDWAMRTFRKFIAARSVDFWVMSEDLPTPDNRVTVDEAGRIHLARRATNTLAHQVLIWKAMNALSKAGLPVCFVDERGTSAIQHQCGTVRFGNDPKTSVLDQWCRTHEVANLYVMDASFFPSSAAVNPALTVLAQTLRAAEHLKASLL
ncbi:MAG: GMC family oxidoreductase [Spirochaetales bacterium]